MKIGDALSLAIKTKSTQAKLAKDLGLKSQSVIAQRLRLGNISVEKAVEMLNAVEYEMVIQPIKRGRRSDGQIKITICDEPEDTDA